MSQDNYIVATYSRGATGIKALFCTDTAHVVNTVKALSAKDLSVPGHALKRVFEAVHLVCVVCGCVLRM